MPKEMSMSTARREDEATRDCPTGISMKTLLRSLVFGSILALAGNPVLSHADVSDRLTIAGPSGSLGSIILNEAGTSSCDSFGCGLTTDASRIPIEGGVMIPQTAPALDIAERQNLCSLIPVTLPSGMQPLNFEECPQPGGSRISRPGTV